MSGAAGTDVRYPIGGLFLALGIVLAGFGVATRGDTVLYAPSGNLNINLLWGVVMLVFGLLMLALAATARRRECGSASQLAMDDTEGVNA